MARVLAYVPDLLFGSSVLTSLQAAGHEVRLASQPGPVEEGTDVLIVDLTAEAPERIARVAAVERGGARTLAFYSHVEAEVRAQAEEAGFDLVVPRSRMAREGAALVSRLAGG